MPFRAPGRLWACLLAFTFLSGCAGSKDVPAADAGGTLPDRVISRLLDRGAIDQAQGVADSLSASGDGVGAEIGAYWRAVCWLYRDYPDSAVAILEANENRWSGGMRRVHAGVLLRLARETSLARSAAYARREDSLKPAHGADAPHRTHPDKGLADKIEALQREVASQRAEIARLEREKDKYRKLLKDLETIR